MSRRGRVLRSTENIDFKVHFANKRVLSRLVKVQYMSAKEMMADIMTKLLAAPELVHQRERKGLLERADGNGQEK